VVLFMKGTPSQPMCGFSAQTVRLLHQHGVDVTGVDVLSNPILRTAMKEYSQWPTFPQL
jgi:monothiol glutaredoxin